METLKTPEEVKQIKTGEDDIHPLLKARWSPRAFDSRIPAMDTLERLFQAARWSPSSGNAQPWSFIMGIKEKGGTWQKIWDILDDGNREWCAHVPVLVLTISYSYFKNGTFNYHHHYDLGQAVAHLTVQAMSEGIYAHQMGGFYPGKVLEAFQLPAGHEAVSCMALGYPGSLDMLNEKNYRQETTPRQRKPLAEIVFDRLWGMPFSF